MCDLVALEIRQLEGVKLEVQRLKVFIIEKENSKLSISL